MAYFKINNNDYSLFVNSLKVGKVNNYTSQTNAAGDTVADLIGSKRTIEVGIIPLNDTDMKKLLADLDLFSVSLSFRNPRTNELAEGVSCIIPSDDVSYYTIQQGKVMYQAFTLKFTEL